MIPIVAIEAGIKLVRAEVLRRQLYAAQSQEAIVKIMGERLKVFAENGKYKVRFKTETDKMVHQIMRYAVVNKTSISKALNEAAKMYAESGSLHAYPKQMNRGSKNSGLIISPRGQWRNNARNPFWRPVEVFTEKGVVKWRVLIPSQRIKAGKFRWRVYRTLQEAARHAAIDYRGLGKAGFSQIFYGLRGVSKPKTMTYGAKVDSYHAAETINKSEDVEKPLIKMTSLVDCLGGSWESTRIFALGKAANRMKGMLDKQLGYKNEARGASKT